MTDGSTKTPTFNMLSPGVRSIKIKKESGESVEFPLITLNGDRLLDEIIRPKKRKKKNKPKADEMQLDSGRDYW